MWIFLLSALCYALSLLYIASFFWLVVPAFFLLFLGILTRSVTFSHGFAWGLVAYGLQILPLFVSLFHVVHTKAIFVAWVVVALYFALHAAVWFWLLAVCFRMLPKLWSRIIFLSITSWLYLCWVDRGILWIFDCFEGYPLIHPLVPLMRVPQLFYWLPSVQVEGMAFLFVVTMLMCAVLCIDFSLCYFGILLACLVGWGSGFAVSSITLEKPDWINRVGVIRTDYRPSQIVYPFDFVQEFSSLLIHMHSQRPSVDVIIAPESAAPCYLNQHMRALRALCENSIDTQVLLGGYYYGKKGGCNCCYWIDHGFVRGLYGKGHGVPFVERVPRWFDCAFLRSCFFVELDPFITPKAQCFDFMLLPGLVVRPLLCSELFFDRIVGVDSCLDTIVLALVNDAWFMGYALAQTLWLVAQLRARSAGVPLLYVSYDYAYFLDKQGGLWRL